MLKDKIKQYYISNGFDEPEIQIYDDLVSFVDDLVSDESFRNIHLNYKTLPNYKIRSMKYKLNWNNNKIHNDIIWKNILLEFYQDMNDVEEKAFELFKIINNKNKIAYRYEELKQEFLSRDIKIKREWAFMPSNIDEQKELELLNFIESIKKEKDPVFAQELDLKTQLFESFHFYFLGKGKAMLITNG